MEDWYSEFLTNVLPGRFGWVDRFNHTYAARSERPHIRTLEIGPGNGSHLEFEDIASQDEYVALELRESLSSLIGDKYPNVTVAVGDCQEELAFEDNSFDRVLAIHVLEHLDNLPVALKEIARVLKPTGVFSVVIPCEAGKLYALGRRLTVQRRFEKRYGLPYRWMIEYDHVNTAAEVMQELDRGFTVDQRQFFPFRIPSVDANVVIGLTLRPRP